MSWKAKTGREQKVLASIAATLLALADLAESAAGRSPWVRWCVLWSAWQADLIARDFVAGSAWNKAGRHWSPVLPMVRYGTDPADALDIAASLRALAQMVCTLAAELCRLSQIRQGLASASSACQSGPLHDTVRLPSNAAVIPRARFDTS